MPDLITSDNQMNVTLAEGIVMVGAGLMVSPNVKYEAMEKALKTLIEMERVTSWCLGDALNAAERVFGEKSSQLISMTGYSYSYMMNCSSMANLFKPEDRMNLSFTHHVVVQKYDSEKRRRYLQTAVDNQMGLSEFKQYVRKMEGKDRHNQDHADQDGYVFAVMEAPIQRGQLWEVLADENARQLSEEQLQSMGIPVIHDQNKVIVIVPRYTTERDDEQAVKQLEDTDGSIKEGDDDSEIPFG